MAEELSKLRQQIVDLQQKAEALEAKEKAKALEEVREKISMYHMTAHELGFAKARASYTPSKQPVAPKYKKGHETWSGRGRQPRWVADHISKGGKIEELLIK